MEILTEQEAQAVTGAGFILTEGIYLTEGFFVTEKAPSAPAEANGFILCE